MLSLTWDRVAFSTATKRGLVIVTRPLATRLSTPFLPLLVYSVPLGFPSGRLMDRSTAVGCTAIDYATHHNSGEF